MCGIAGIISEDKVVRYQIKRMTKILQHRGPDEFGFFEDSNAALGQTRLSINDISHGQQPISNETGDLVLICNGEIYNYPELKKGLIEKGHQFKTGSDVEAILHLYEEYKIDCVNHLRGMFAFAIWDKKEKSLFIARDHHGQKPLFFVNKNGSFFFASEIKSLLKLDQVNPEINIEALSNFISLRFIHDEITLFKGINKLTAASWLLYKNGDIKTGKYWDINYNSKLNLNEEDLIDKLDEVLTETVKLHLLSDVKIGSFLSGGIDSSLLTAIMAKVSKKSFPTFSIGVLEDEYNEIPYAKIVSDKFNLQHHVEIVKADLIHLLPSMVYHMEEPADPFGVGVYLAAKHAHQKVKVVIGGDGGDENFAGYDRYIGNRLVDPYSHIPKWIRKGIISRFFDMMPSNYGYKNLAQKFEWADEMSDYNDGARYSRSMSFHRFSPEAKQLLFTSDALAGLNEIDNVEQILRYFNAPNADHLIDKMLYTDLMTRIPDHLLTVVDRMSMAHSLETRSPFLDHKITEFAASIPPGMKANGKNLKYILKKLSARYLPKVIVDRKKQGFGFPIARWIQNDLSNFIKNLFERSILVEAGIFRKDFMDHILDEHISGKKDHNFRIWILLNLELWYRIYFEDFSVESSNELIEELIKD